MSTTPGKDADQRGFALSDAGLSGKWLHHKDTSQFFPRIHLDPNPEPSTFNHMTIYLGVQDGEAIGEAFTLHVRSDGKNVRRNTHGNFSPEMAPAFKAEINELKLAVEALVVSNNLPPEHGIALYESLTVLEHGIDTVLEHGAFHELENELAALVDNGIESDLRFIETAVPSDPYAATGRVQSFARPIESPRTGIDPT